MHLENLLYTKPAAICDLLFPLSFIHLISNDQGLFGDIPGGRCEIILFSPRFWSSGNLREQQALLRFCWLEFRPWPSVCNITAQCLSIFKLKAPKELQSLMLSPRDDFHGPSSSHDLYALIFWRKIGWPGTGQWWWRLLKWQITDPLIRFKTGLLSCEVVSSNEILFSFSHISFNLQQCWEKIVFKGHQNMIHGFCSWVS